MTAGPGSGIPGWDVSPSGAGPASGAVSPSGAGPASGAVSPSGLRPASGAVSPGGAVPGTRLGGRYRLDERVGAGGMGEVWRATDEVLGRVVAVKLILATLVSEAGFERRFLGEAQAMARVSHPGVVAVHDYASDAAGAYLVMQYVHGEPLSAMLQRVGPLHPRTTMDIVAQAAAALHAVHGEGVVHRDVKPANLMLRPDGTVMLADFGIARTPANTALTMSGVVLGTPLYLAPEQVLGQPATPRSDVYALGLVAYECLVGQRPFQGDNAYAIALQRLQQPAPELPDYMPAGVRAVVAHALAADPAASVGERRRDGGCDPGRDASRPSGDRCATTAAPGNSRTTPRIMRPAPRRRRGRRSRRTRSGRAGAAVVIAAAAVLALIVGAGLWLVGDLGSTARPGTSSPDTNVSGTAKAAGGVPAGFVSCAGGYCPVTPACWHGLVDISGVTSMPERVDCAQPHYWQTFLVGKMPSADVGVPQDALMERPDVAGICSAAALARHSRHAADTTTWRRDALPVQLDGGWVVYCIAGSDNGESTGSLS